MQQLRMTGTSQNGQKPFLVFPLKTDTLGKPNLVSVLFETNPLDKLCNQRLKVFGKALEMMYDAETVICLSNIFKPPKELSLKK
jgi:vacuolar protein sorting-associated protein 13A/C